MRIPSPNNVFAKLEGAINSSVTSFNVTQTVNFPSSGYLAISGGSDPKVNEIISYTGRSGHTLTGVTRGVDGTSAESHADGSYVGIVIINKHLEEVWDILKGTLGAGVINRTNSFTISTENSTDIINFYEDRHVTFPTLTDDEIGTLHCLKIKNKENIYLQGPVEDDLVLGENRSWIFQWDGTTWIVIATSKEPMSRRQQLELLLADGFDECVIEHDYYTSGPKEGLLMGTFIYESDIQNILLFNIEYFYNTAGYMTRIATSDDHGNFLDETITYNANNQRTGSEVTYVGV